MITYRGAGHNIGGRKPRPAMTTPEPLTPEELDNLRALPIVNRNGSTGDLVDRLLATLDARQAPDTSGLRERLTTLYMDSHGEADYVMVSRKDLGEVVAALANASYVVVRAEDGLDAERLANAYNNVMCMWGDQRGQPVIMADWREIAAEYAALRAATERP